MSESHTEIPAWAAALIESQSKLINTMAANIQSKSPEPPAPNNEQKKEVSMPTDAELDAIWGPVVPV